MAEIKIYVDSGRIFFIENEDRNGPAMSIAMADKQAFRQAINRMSVDGDEEIMAGEYSRIERHNTEPVALFKTEAEADAYVTAIGSSVRKVREVAVDGFDFKAVTV